MNKCMNCGDDLTTAGCTRCAIGGLKSRRTPHKCPCCDGTGKVSRPPFVPGDQVMWSSGGAGIFPCNACKETGIVWEPV